MSTIFHDGDVQSAPARSPNAIPLTIANILLLVCALSLVCIAVFTFQPSGYEHVVFSVPDSQLEQALIEIGAQGWAVASARRALGGEDADRKSSYEVIVSRRIPRMFGRVPPRTELLR